MLRKRLSLLTCAALAMLALSSSFAPTPARAHADVCIGGGGLNLADGVGLPVFHGSVTTNFNFIFHTAVCSAKTQLTATGTFTGLCGLATGKGTTNNGHNFDFVVAAFTMTFTGGVTGELHIISDPLSPGSCTNKTQTRFLVAGKLVKPPH